VTLDLLDLPSQAAHTIARYPHLGEALCRHQGIQLIDASPQLGLAVTAGEEKVFGASRT